MKLKDIAQNPRDPLPLNSANTLPETLSLWELTPALLASCGETVFLRAPGGPCTGTVSRELLEYLLNQRRIAVFDNILDHIQDGVIAVDAEGRIFYMNQAYTDILHIKPRHIMGRYIQDIEPDSLLCQVLRTKKPAENKRQRIASIEKNVSTRIVPLFDNGIFIAAISIFRDVTELHDLNKQVRRMSGIVNEYAEQLQTLSTVQGLNILTEDKAYLTILEQAAVVARTDVPILIRGENGVGKELMANYIHQCSARKDAPLITINCAAIPAELLESELFGYEEGSFTGAVKGGKKGKFELADKGTIFLDEIGDMPINMQSKLLRVIQQGEIEKLGRQKNIKVDVRILAATNQPLEELIEEKKFRQDLYFRLNVFTMRIPPLRERRGDIVLLTNHFLERFNEKYGKSVKVSVDAYTHLQAQPWEGNIRELQGCVERAVILEDEALLFGNRTPSPPGSALPPSGNEPPSGTLRELMWAYEDQLLRQAIMASDTRTQAMELLGLSRRTFYRKCAEHGL